MYLCFYDCFNFTTFILSLQRCKEDDPDLVTRFKNKKSEKPDHRERDRFKERDRDRDYEREKHYKERDGDSSYIPSHSTYHEEKERKPKKRRDTFVVPSKLSLQLYFYFEGFHLF